MKDKKPHIKESKLLFGDYSLAEPVGSFLDDKFGLRNLGPHHRATSHTWERIDSINKIFGEQGYLDALLHIALDYKILNPIAGKRKICRKGK